MTADWIVSYDVAALANTKGFIEDIQCSGYYVAGTRDHVYRSIRSVRDIDSLFLAPSQSLVQKWLREIHGIHITVHHHKTRKFNASVEDECENHIADSFSLFFGTYEQALDLALIDALNTLKYVKK